MRALKKDPYYTPDFPSVSTYLLLVQLWKYVGKEGRKFILRQYHHFNDFYMSLYDKHFHHIVVQKNNNTTQDNVRDGMCGSGSVCVRVLIVYGKTKRKLERLSS